jgi:WD40 repeat protein
MVMCPSSSCCVCVCFVHDLGSHRGAVNACCSLTKDAAATGGSDGSIRIWRLGSKVLATIMQAPDDASVVALGSTKFGDTLVSASSNRLSVWDVNAEHIRSESFLKVAGNESYQRQLAAVRRSLPGLFGADGGRRSSARRQSIDPALVSPRSPSSPLGSRDSVRRSQSPWSSTGRTVVNLARPPNPLPSEMHSRGSSRPVTGSMLSSNVPGYAPIPTTVPLPAKKQEF